MSEPPTQSHDAPCHLFSSEPQAAPEVGSSSSTIDSATRTPQPVKTVARWIVAGLVITFEEGLAWANRLRAARGDEPLQDIRGDHWSVLMELDQRVQELHGYGAMYWGRGTGDPLKRSQMIIMTRYDAGQVPLVNGKATLTPEQAKSGPIESMAAETLKEQERECDPTLLSV
ncbi:hypothetical protein GLOTRDRAFT_139681 [Gloeophyllum trabeum ATCC 11539]|uniref:Uncharacterized protein n=1 Tax=Gloeophyllum trabeum (strain ATCC 11539 / FP-39264 / Madison 617) TaxID=670483 RepID=S7Q0I7_GLOTA|nr:uncharacterized protein GLOTRDRAFT_139681 [Gloeophyllum trabeum ATCC 11539]EPQ53436.1 hypothetical protein GLOTRDRAFT_139681 [Gloeophyllum trabeum ATCC 11539]